MIHQTHADVMAKVQATLPAECATRGLAAPAEYHVGLPVVTMIQQYPACIVDVDAGSIGGQQGTEMLHAVFVAVVDRDQDLSALNVRLMQYADAVVAALDGTRFGSVIRCTASKHDSSNLVGVGESRAVRMRWVQFEIRTIG